MDAELATLHARIAQIEEAKRIPPPPKSIETLRDETASALKRNSYSKSVPLAAFYDRQRLEMFESILDSLKKIHARLDALESR